jgi:hypothetical protein
VCTNRCFINRTVFLTRPFLKSPHLSLCLCFNFFNHLTDCHKISCGCFIIRYISILCFLVITNVNMANTRTSTTSCKGKVKLSHCMHGQALGTRRLRLPELLDSPHMKVVRLSALRTVRLYPPLPGNIPGTHFC